MHPFRNLGGKEIPLYMSSVVDPINFLFGFGNGSEPQFTVRARVIICVNQLDKHQLCKSLAMYEGYEYTVAM